LSEFLDLQQGNHIVFEYCRQFNNLTQYGTHHIDMDEKKAELFRKGLSAQLQDCLILFPNLSYNDLASTTIDQEGTLKACVEVEDNKRKRVMSGSSGDSSDGAPSKYHIVYTPHAGQPQRPPQQF
jgi:hypothetical protein